jgi:hypothetical protein
MTMMVLGVGSDDKSTGLPFDPEYMDADDRKYVIALTVAIILTYLSMCAAVWPVYGALSILLLPVASFSVFIMSAGLMPNFLHYVFLIGSIGGFYTLYLFPNKEWYDYLHLSSTNTADMAAAGVGAAAAMRSYWDPTPMLDSRGAGASMMASEHIAKQVEGWKETVQAVSDAHGEAVAKPLMEELAKNEMKVQDARSALGVQHPNGKDDAPAPASHSA